MGSVGSYIFGSGPSTSTVSPQPVNQLDPYQQGAEDYLYQQLPGPTSNFLASTASPYSGQLTAPVGDLQQQALDSFSNQQTTSDALVNQLTSGQSAPLNQSLAALEGGLTTAQSPATADAYFQNAVAAPQEQNFTQNVLPSIVSALGGNAGGPQSTAASSAVTQATNNLETTMGQEQQQFAAGEQSLLPTLASDLSTTALAPLGAATQGLANAGQTLTAGGVPQSIAQAGLTNTAGQYQTNFSDTQSFLNDLLGMIGESTTTPQDVVVNPGSSGLLSSVVQAFASGAGKSASDERWKKDISRVGTADNDLPIYMYHFKDESPTAPMHVGLMAQDVEQFRPSAVTEVAGWKFVDYLAALQHEDA